MTPYQRLRLEKRADELHKAFVQSTEKAHRRMVSQLTSFSPVPTRTADRLIEELRQAHVSTVYEARSAAAQPFGSQARKLGEGAARAAQSRFDSALNKLRGVL